MLENGKMVVRCVVETRTEVFTDNPNIVTRQSEFLNSDERFVLVRGVDNSI